MHRARNAQCPLMIRTRSFTRDHGAIRSAPILASLPLPFTYPQAEAAPTWIPRGASEMMYEEVVERLDPCLNTSSKVASSRSTSLDLGRCGRDSCVPTGMQVPQGQLRSDRLSGGSPLSGTITTSRMIIQEKDMQIHEPSLLQMCFFQNCALRNHQEEEVIRELVEPLRHRDSAPSRSE